MTAPELPFVARVVLEAYSTHDTALFFQDRHVDHASAGLLAGLMLGGWELRELHLARAGLLQHGVLLLMRAVGESACLQVLDLYENPMSDVWLGAMEPALLANHTLRKLDLASTSLEHGMADMLGRVLRHNTTLHTLNVSANVGLQYFMLCIMKGLQSNRTLRAFYANHIPMCEEDVKAVTDVLLVNEALTSVELIGSLWDDAGRRYLAAALPRFHPALRKLFLCAADHIADERYLEGLGQNPHIIATGGNLDLKRCTRRNLNRYLTVESLRTAAAAVVLRTTADDALESERLPPLVAAYLAQVAYFLHATTVRMAVVD